MQIKTVVCGLERGKGKKPDGDKIVCGRQHTWRGKGWDLTSKKLQ